MLPVEPSADCPEWSSRGQPIAVSKSERSVVKIPRVMRKMTLLAAVMALGVPVALADAPEGEKKEVGFARQHRPVLFERRGRSQ